ncbi:hypothetical protein DMENIID0001_152000 [Sergentomyia squamirostris]
MKKISSVNMNSSPLQVVLPFLRLFQIFPLALANPPGGRRENDIRLLIWCHVNLLVLCLVVAAVVLFRQDIFFTRDIVGFLSDFAQYAAPASSHFIILTNSIVNRRKICKMWRFLLPTAKMEHFHKNKNLSRRLIFKLIGTSLLCFTTELYIVVAVQSTGSWFLNRLASILSLLYCHTSNLHYILCVEILMMHIDVMIREVETLTQHKSSNRLKKMTWRMQLDHGGLWLATKWLNKSCGVAQLYNMCQVFVYLCCTLYWTWISLIFKSNPWYIESILCSLPPILSLTVYFHTCNEFYTKVFYMDTSMGTFTDVLQLVAPVLTHFIMLIEAQNFRQMDLKMWSRIEHVDRMMSVPRAASTKSLVKAVAFNALSLIVDIYVIVSVHPVATEWARLCCARIFSFCVERLMVTHYVLHIDYIANRLNEIKEQIEHTSKMVTIKKLIQSHRSLWELSTDINKRSTYAILAALIDNFILLTVNTYWCYTKLHYGHFAFIYGIIFNFSSQFRTFMDIIQLYFPIGGYLVAICESIKKRDKIFKIWTNYSKINVQLKAIGVIEQRDFFGKLLRKFLTECIIINGLALVVEVKIISALDSKGGWFQHRIAALVPFNGNRMAIFYFLLHIHITRGYLEILASQLQRLRHKIESQGKMPQAAMENVLTEIKVLKVIQRNLWEICYNIDKSFTWTLLCIITMYFLILIVDLYWWFLKILVGSTYRVTESFLCVIPLVLSFVPLVYTADTLLQASTGVSCSLQKIHIHPQYSTPHQFALQLHLLTMEFSPKRIFSVDFKLFTAFITTMGMYLIILFQFELGRSQIGIVFK